MGAVVGLIELGHVEPGIDRDTRVPRGAVAGVLAAPGRQLLCDTQQTPRKICGEYFSTRGQKHRAALRSNYPLDHSMV